MPEEMHAVSLEEYLKIEKSKNEKFEFFSGNVWSVSGASLQHNQIAMNLLSGIDKELRFDK